jgi:hypothetical protein
VKIALCFPQNVSVLRVLIQMQRDKDEPQTRLQPERGVMKRLEEMARSSSRQSPEVVDRFIERVSHGAASRKQTEGP